MPYIQVTWLEGRTREQKRKIAARITDVMVEEAGAGRDKTIVTFVDLPHTDYATGGVPMADQKKSP